MISADVPHKVPLFFPELMPEAFASCWVFVTPWSTATQISDADNSCHLSNIIQGRMRTPICIWSQRANKQLCLGVHVQQGGGRLNETRRACKPYGGACRWLQKVLPRFSNQHGVSRNEGKRSPLSSLGQQEKGWMNLKPTSERLAMSHSAEQRFHLPTFCWMDRSTEPVQLICREILFIMATIITCKRWGSGFLRITRGNKHISGGFKTLL